MKSENYINIYQVLREEIGKLCEKDCEIMDMEQRKRKVSKAFLKEAKVSFAIAKAHFKGMCDMANLTGEFVRHDNKSAIDSEFGWIYK
jgi:hypothetical protein